MELLYGHLSWTSQGTQALRLRLQLETWVAAHVLCDPQVQDRFDIVLLHGAHHSVTWATSKLRTNYQGD